MRHNPKAEWIYISYQRQHREEEKEKRPRPLATTVPYPDCAARPANAA